MHKGHGYNLPYVLKQHKTYGKFNYLARGIAESVQEMKHNSEFSNG